MSEFYQLRQELLVSTFVIGGIVFPCVWFFYTANVALNYAIGACVGFGYLRMLGRDVERLGRDNRHLSKARFALLIVPIVLASRLSQLKILPIFLGFLTYKAALLVYVLRVTLLPEQPGRKQRQ